MDEEMKVKLLEYLTALEAGVKQGGDFVAEQAPLVLQEFLAWEFWSSCFWGFVWACVSCFLLYLAKLLSKSHCNDGEEEAARFVVVCIVVAFTCIPAGVSLNRAARALQVKVAPRVVILEKAAELAKGLR